MDNMDIGKLIWKMAIKNALLHEGKASKQAVINYLLGAEPSLRQKIKEIFPEVERIVSEVNGLPPATIEEMAKDYGVVIEEKRH